MELDLQALLNDVKRGQKLTHSDRVQLREATYRDSETDDLYTVLHILWRNGAPEDTDIFESLSNYGESDPQDDGMIRRLCLQALADMAPTQATFSLLTKRLSDSNKVVRLVAYSRLGDLASQNSMFKIEAAGILLERLADTKPGTAEYGSIYEGMLNLLSVPERDRPNIAQAISDQNVSEEVLGRIDALAERGLQRE